MFVAIILVVFLVCFAFFLYDLVTFIREIVWKD